MIALSLLKFHSQGEVDRATRWQYVQAAKTFLNLESVGDVAGEMPSL